MFDVEQFNESHITSLAALTGEPIVTDEDVKSARACLAVAWENVKDAGSSSWKLESAPSLSITIMLSAAARAWMNLGGFIDERADAVTLSRSTEFAVGAELTAQERARLERLAGRNLVKNTLRSEAATAITTTDMTLEDSTPWWKRNVMVYGPLMSPTTALPIPYLPGDESKAAASGDIAEYRAGHYSSKWPFTNRINGVM